MRQKVERACRNSTLDIKHIYPKIDSITTPPVSVSLCKTVCPNCKENRTGVNFINILRTNFLYERRFSSFFYIHVTREKLPKQRLYEKFVCKMLMKLTTGNLEMHS